MMWSKGQNWLHLKSRAPEKVNPFNPHFLQTICGYRTHKWRLVCLSVTPDVSMSFCLLFCLSVRLSIYLSLCLSLSLCMYEFWWPKLQYTMYCNSVSVNLKIIHFESQYMFFYSWFFLLLLGATLLKSLVKIIRSFYLAH